MKVFLYVSFILTILIFSCKQQKQNDSIPTASINQIRHILRETKLLSLPFIFDANNSEKLSINYHIDPYGLDSIIFSETVLSIIGYLPDTSNFYAFLVGEPGDMFYPNIITYDKNGKRISKELVSTCNCLTSPIVEVESCYDSVIINKNLTFNSFSQLKASVQPYDSINTVFDAGTDDKLFGRIESNGMIYVEKENK